MIAINPYKSVGPICFGMDSDSVRAQLGEPTLSTKDRRGNVVLRYDGVHVTISTEGVVEVELLPKTPVELSGISIFSDSQALKLLCHMDGKPKIIVGAVILMNLGISMTGFHDKDESQKSVTAFAKARFDVLKPQLKPFVLPND